MVSEVCEGIVGMAKRVFGPSHVTVTCETAGVREVRDRPTDYSGSGVHEVRDRPTDSGGGVRILGRRLGKTPGCWSAGPLTSD